MRKIVLLFLAAATLSACGIDKPDRTVEGKVRFAAKMADMMSGAINGRDEIRAIEADGRTLVLKLNLDKNVEGPITEADILEQMRPEVCKNDAFINLLKEGAAIRVELFTPDGKSLPPATFRQCPSASPA